MAIDKLIPQYLNSDTDQKLVKSVEMTDNLNVRVSNDAEGTAGVIKNVKGTDVVSPRTSNDSFPSGDNRVIGAVDNQKNKEILFLVWNSNNDHGIYRLDMTTGKYQKLYEDSVLNFKKFSYADCDVVINEEGSTLFYWTDNSNPPMKVNVNRLLKSDYPTSFYSGTNEEKLLSLTVAKQPPLKAPSFNYVNNVDIKKNNIYEKTFQFAYQYKYKDGELSALSEYSPVTVASTQLQDGFIPTSTKEFYNQINVYVRNSVADVDEIILYAKNSNLQTFYEVEKIKNNGTNGVSTIKFIDDKISKSLSADEVRKNYDNVPQLAKAQAVVNNRLMYGNYKEGYENVDVDVDINPIHHDAPEFFKVDVSHNGTSDVVVKNDTSLQFDIDFSEVPSTLSANHRVFLEFTIVPDRLTVSEAGTFGLYGDIVVDIKHPDDDNIEQLTLKADNSAAQIKFSPQGITVSKMFSFSQATSKSAFLTQVSDFLSSNYFESAVSTEERKYNYATVGDVKTTPNTLDESAVIWYGGISFFTFEEISKTSDELTIELKFSGAELYIRELDVKGGNWFTNIWTGFKSVEVINSESLKIGGQGTFNKYASVSDVKPTANSGARYRDTIVAGNASFGGKTVGDKTFKSDSNHSLGIVYFDDRGRAGGVNKLDDVYVPAVSDRDEKGHTELDLRIKNTAPSWAKKWMPVYAGNSSFSDYIQYTTGDAFASLDSKENLGSPLGKRIYVSMSTLEGSETSYKEQTGADIDYKYEKGDEVKIISYKDGNGDTVYPDDFVFNVVDYKYFDEEDTKIFLNRTGDEVDPSWFLILDSEDYTDFSAQDVIANSSFWSSETIIEIRKPLKEVTEKVYYGLGKTYDIVDGVHEGDRSVTSAPSATLTIDGVGGITSSDRLFIGDTIDVSGTVITITGITIESDGSYSYTYRGVVSAQASASYTIGNYQNGVVTISQGDSYFRVRKLRISDTYEYDELTKKLRTNRYAYSGGYIEDRSVSDFFSSKVYTKGKPYAHLPDAKTVHRRSSITYSDAYVIDSDRLNLSSFNLSLANWKDLDLTFGSIQSLVHRGDAVTAIQESKASSIPVSRNLIEYSGGTAGVTVSNKVLGNVSYYAGDFGTTNPESVVERFGVVYYVDVRSGKVIRLSADGITPISEKGLDSFIEDKFKSLLTVSEKVIVVGGFDPDNNEYLITVEPVYNATITVGSDVNNVPVDANAEFTINGMTFTSQTVLWNIWGNLWNTFCGNWEDVGNGVVYVDSVFTPQSILVDSAFIGSTGTINVLITNNGYTFSAIGTLDLSTGIVTLPSTTCEGDSITLGDAQTKEQGFTLAYKHKEGRWGSKYSFKPTMYVNINNELYSFFETDSGLMWKHNVNNTRNTFYGTSYDSFVEVVSNPNPSMIKVYEAVGIEGTGTWSASFKNDEQSTSLTTSDFETREGHRYAMIPRDEAVSTSHQVYLGKVESITSDKVTFTTPINRLPFVVGDILKTASGSTLTGTGMEISGIDGRKTIQCTTAISNISVGDNVFVEHSAKVNGDPMRGVYLKTKITSSDTSAFEVHALSFSYDRSKLHNDRVN